MSMRDECPIIKIFRKSLFFGLASIDYYVEDRRPDLEVGDYVKFKHYINIRVLWKKFHWIFRTTLPYDNNPYVI